MFCETIGRLEWAKDPRFANRNDRAKNRLELAKLVEEWLQSYATRDEPLAILEKARILSAPVLDIAQIATHPVITERGAMQAIEHPGIGPIALPKSPFRMSETPTMIRDRVPFLGEHNEKVLGTYLGYSREKIAELTKVSVLVRSLRDGESKSSGRTF
jgi:crotonobetainyl-CoA:carnitine CoA-transferase CaiB-like acyl-CoA transferase